VSEGVSVNELMLAFFDHAKQHYRRSATEVEYKGNRIEKLIQEQTRP
jgi:hypothetical protein